MGKEWEIPEMLDKYYEAPTEIRRADTHMYDIH